MKEHKQMYYFETKKVRPISTDGSVVMAWNGECWSNVYFANLYFDDLNNEDPADYYTHWMQMPKAPCDDDRDF